MYAMLAVSNSGSIAIDSHHTDWPTEQACQHAARTLYTTPERATINGVQITIKLNVQCVPVDGVVEMQQPVYGNQPPPPPSPPPPYGPRFRIGPMY
jgi:hypothetical protein